MCERGVNGAFGKSRSVGDRAHTGADVTPFVSCGQAVKVQVNYKSGRLFIVPDQIAHEHIENVIVDRNGLSETRHLRRMK